MRRAIERRRRRSATLRLAVVAALLIGLLAAAYALGRSSGGSGGDDPLVIDCVQRTATLDKWPREGWEDDAVITGPVAFYGAADAAREQPKDGRVTTELPVLIDAEKQVTITARNDEVALGFADEPATARSVTLKACPATYHEFGTNRKVGPFTQFTGDFTADEPECVELDVQVYGEDDAREAQFGLGQSC